MQYSLKPELLKQQCQTTVYKNMNTLPQLVFHSTLYAIRYNVRFAIRQVFQMCVVFRVSEFHIKIYRQG